MLRRPALRTSRLHASASLPQPCDVPTQGASETVAARSGASFAVAALTVGLFWAAGSLNHLHPEVYITVFFVAGILLGAALAHGYHQAEWGVLAYVVAIGIAGRCTRSAFNGSDVVGTIMEAIRLVTHGANPYAHTFVYSNPPGSPFPYLPGQIAWYALFQRVTGQVVGTDQWAGMGIVVLLAMLALRVGPGRAAFGTALYATFQPAILRSLDGSNDTSLAFLVLLAVALLAAAQRFRSDLFFYASAVIFGWALLFKAFAWLIFPFVVNHLRRTGESWPWYAATGLSATILVSLPFFLTAPAGFVHNLLGGLSFHREPFGLDLWAVLDYEPQTRIGISIAPIAVVAVVPVTTVLQLRFPAASLAGAFLQGCIVVFVALFFARYATSSYDMFACAILTATLALWPWAGASSPWGPSCRLPGLGKALSTRQCAPTRH